MSAEEPGQQGGEPTEEELRAAYEAELSRIGVTDVIAQTAVSLLNLGARRLGPAPGAPPDAQAERDLDQARDAIDGARALLEILERRIPDQVRGLRDALSQLQMAYAATVGQGGAPPPESAPAAETPSPGADPKSPAKAGEEDEQRPGPAEASGRLWVPGR